MYLGVLYSQIYFLYVLCKRKNQKSGDQKMTILFQTEMKSSFAKAVANPENINEDGSINWNFVDSDIWLDSDEQGWEPSESFIETMIVDHLKK